MVEEAENSKDTKSHSMAGVGRDLKGRLVPSPCNEQGHLPPHQVPQGPIHDGLEHLWGWDIHTFSGQPVPVPVPVPSTPSK